MSSTTPPLEAQRFGRSQTPESPRPVHIPEPANIPVLLNQMDPVFNDTATYNIPHNQTFSPFPEPAPEQITQISGLDEQDAVQNFFREAENQATAEPKPNVTSTPDVSHATPNVSTEVVPFLSEPLADKFPTVYQDLNSKAFTMNSTEVTAPQDATEEITTANEEKDTQPEAEELGGMLNTAVQEGQGHQGTQQEPMTKLETESGVDYQSLLDTISQSASTAPAAENLTILAATAPLVTEDVSRPPASVPGLPPKPPPQEHPIDFPSYSSYDAATSQQKPLNLLAESQNTNDQHNGVEANPETSPEQSASQDKPTQYYPLPPSFAGYGQAPATNSTPLPEIPSQAAPGQELNRSMDPTERPWTPKTQSQYDHFLEDERRYVTEGIWDKFPLGSRLFVGNLPSEKVTKRDLFHKFHRHGKLAQISIKQAYGFVQFHEAAACQAALNAEQGVEIRGRKVHLEVSKPQKNTKNAGGGGKKEQGRRRSRSPDRGSRRESRNYSDFRDESGRRRDEFRRRSPSPHSYRHRDDYRPGGRDGRSRSPFYGSSYNAPQGSSLDDEASLQLPRRDPRQVPDVQLLVLEPEVVQSFINWVEQGLRAKGLQASTIWVNNRLPLPAVVKRQIIEGVQAVVKLTRVAQNNSKIPLQVFDRSAGASNVMFNEYVDLDVGIAADVVLQARQKERGGFQASNFRPQTFSPQGYQMQAQAQYNAPQAPLPYSQPAMSQYSPQQPQQQQPHYNYAGPQQAGYRPQQPPTPTAAPPPNLQQLLANLRQPATPSAPQGPSTGQHNQAANLSGFLGNLSNQAQYSQVQLAGLGQYGASPPPPPPPPPPQGGQQPNMQNIMEQLARYQR